ncbi:MAG: hypothetical protein KTR25_07295 [Myxococcales bacterium]|nr:hypothetical protein [Myxococcales bacterium]
MTRLIVAEKPSVARDIARGLGPHNSVPDAFVGDGWLVTWLYGHVAELLRPGDMNPIWRSWRLEDLPILPLSIPWSPTTRGRERIEAIKRLLEAYSVEAVVCATDAGREGELIFRYLWTLLETILPVERLWVSSLAPEEIRSAWNQRKPAEDYRGLADAALGRAWADWWLGMNASRALTLTHGQPLAAGRVQTPTLAAVVLRDREISEFVSKTSAWLEVEIETDVPWVLRWKTHFDPEDPNIQRLMSRLLASDVVVTEVREHSIQIPPPRLYNLEGLQQEANTRLGLTAHQTLEIAQRLYEKYKVLSYPRTSSKVISRATATRLIPVVRTLIEQWGCFLEAEDLEVLGSPYVDDSQVYDHPALYPVALPTRPLEDIDAQVFDLVQRRLLAVISEPGIDLQVEIKAELPGLSGVLVGQAQWPVCHGWRTIDGVHIDSGTRLPTGLVPGMRLQVGSVAVVEESSAPPRRLSDGELIRIMESHHLGTSATRADILEGLIKKGYLVREGICICSSALGRKLINVAPEILQNPRLTAELELHLGKLESKQDTFKNFVCRVHQDVESLVKVIVSTAQLEIEAELLSVRTEEWKPLPGRSSIHSEEVRALLAEGTDPEVLRDALEQINRGERIILWVGSAWTQTRYALLAVGYLAQQVPPALGIVVRGEPALIDDEVMQLRSLGIRAERLHEELDIFTREDVLARFQTESLDVLFVTPLLLGRARKHIQVPYMYIWDDECPGKDVGNSPGLVLLPGISTRSLSSHMQAPVGDALAIEVVLCPEGHRLRALRRAVEMSEGQTLIRCNDQQTAEAIADALKTSAYHSGRMHSECSVAQRHFQDGELPSLVVTSAWPFRLEVPRMRTIVYWGAPLGLQQWAREVFAPSVVEDEVRIIVLYSTSEEDHNRERIDVRMPPSVAMNLLRRPLEQGVQDIEGLCRASGLSPEVVDRYLKLLREHAMIELGNETVSLGSDSAWVAYERERQERIQDAENMFCWLRQRGCRLSNIFSLIAGGGVQRCGRCDGCDPEGMFLTAFSSPTAEELRWLRTTMNLLRPGGGLTIYQLLDGLRGEGVSHRQDVERLVNGLALAGLVRSDGGSASTQVSHRHERWYATSDAAGATHMGFVVLESGVRY